MAVVDFHTWLRSRDADVGQEKRLVEEIARAAGRGADLAGILELPAVRKSGLSPTHLLPLLRSWREYRLLAEQAAALPEPVSGWLELESRRWARRSSPRADEQRRLAASFAEGAGHCRKRARLRWRLLAAAWPEGLGACSGTSHTEGLDLPPHRFLAARRAQAEGAIHIEVVLPENLDDLMPGEQKRPQPAGWRQALEAWLLRELHRRSQRQVIAGAATTLLGLLSAPAAGGPVAGVVTDGKRLFAAMCGGEHDGQQADFPARDSDALAAWLERRRPHQVALYRSGSRRDLSQLLRRLNQQGITCRPLNQAGVMLQARRRPGPLKQAAARVVAERLADPLAATADCDPLELGLGEYLDQVDGQLLAAALADARQAAEWQRKRGTTGVPASAAPTAGNRMLRSLDDLRPGMELAGTVANITHFGAFVDVGLDIEGLVHLSELSERFVEHPAEVVRVGQPVKVRVLEIDRAAGRLALTMRPGERRRRPAPADAQARARRRLEELFKK